MVKKRGKRGFGGWTFLIGVVLAVVLGLLGALTATWLWILVAIGLIVGLLNITEDEVSSFLMAGAVLIIASAFGQDVMSAIPLVNNVLQALLAIFVPATIVVAIRHVFVLARH
ncbi:MAG: hypothetical protein IIA87_05270 [Nanoarchaeota archaeon]|nr:hypothetical protein [Nanoarchaeota archaeon]